MAYINHFLLFEKIIQKKTLDSKKLLSNVDKVSIVRALQKTKDGLPKSFQCTSEPIEEENLSRIPQRDKYKLWDLYDEIREYPDKVLPKLLKLQKKYPEIPCTYNYIATAYAFLKQDRHYLRMLNETVDRFPDYLFGKISLAEYYLNHNQHRKVADILGRNFEIYEHYPLTTKEYHISEVRAFYGVTGRYFARSNKLARALFCYFTIEEIDPEHWTLKQLGDEIIIKEVEKIKRNYAKRAPKKRREKK